MNVLQSSIFKFMNHVNNIKHQYNIISQIKKDLPINTVFIHMDFSENYESKYNREVQSAHFGGSKEQLSLHTVIVYSRLSEKEGVKPKSFCTVTQNIRHDPVAICVHLDPVISMIKEKIPNLKSVHFLSDGPSSQYRNKAMFYLVGTYLTKQLNVSNLQWHYSESGHGKGAPDGVGGYLKRTADMLVSQSKDITNCESFISILKQNSSGIEILDIDDKKMYYLDSILPEQLKTFKGTMQVHQVTWSKSKKNILQARRLSCLDCKSDESCKHFHIGTIDLEKNHCILFLLSFK